MKDVNSPDCEDFKLKNTLLAAVGPEKAPVYYKIGGELNEGLPSDGRTVIKEAVLSSDINTAELSAVCSKGMLISSYLTEYNDFPVVCRCADITNRSSKNSDILSGFGLSFYFEGTSPVISAGNGDTGDCYSFLRRTDIPVNKKISISPGCFLSSSGASPFVTLSFDEYSLILAVGWSGCWNMIIEPHIKGVKISLSQKKINISLKPLETIITPSLTALIFKGSMTKGINLWRRFYVKHLLPLSSGQKISPSLVLRTHSGGENATTENQLQAIDTYYKRGMPFDVWAVDPGWYVCNKNPSDTGDYNCDPDRLPDGFLPVSAKCSHYGKKLSIYFEAERAVSGSKLAYQHPEWLISSDDSKNCLVDIVNKDCFDYMLLTLDNIIKSGNIDIISFNIDMRPDEYMKDASSDRQGAYENLYCQALKSFLSRIKKLNPGIRLNISAMGSGRFDTDVLGLGVMGGCPYTGDIETVLRQHHEKFCFTPYFSACAWEKDDRFPDSVRADEYALMAAAVPEINIMTRFYDSDTGFELMKKFAPVWRRLTHLELYGDYYQLSDFLDGWYAVQFDSPSESCGFIEVIRTKDAPDSKINICPFIRENSKYVFRNPLNGETKRGDGAGLKDGFTFFMPQRKGEIWFYTSEEKDL